MTSEKELWQSVLYQAAIDATYDGDTQENSRERRKAQRWFKNGCPDFRVVCTLAGMDPDFIREAYLAGRIDAAALRRLVDKRAAE